MPIEVEAPDGTIAEFPDGMPAAQIEAVMRQHFPAAQPQATAPTAVAAPEVQQLTSDQLYGHPFADIPAMIYKWAKENPGAAQDFAGQSIGTILGGAATAPGGPGAMAVGAGLGNLAGKVLVRKLTGRSDPDLVEGGIDVATGAAAPAVSAIARPAMRAFTGATPKVADAATLKVLDEAAERGPMAFPTYSNQQILKGQHIKDAALEKIASGNVGELVKQGGQLGALGHMLLTGDIVGAAGWLVGGAAASKAQQAAAAKLLSNDRVLSWLVEAGPKFVKKDYVPERIAAALATLAGEKWLSTPERDAVRTLTQQPEAKGQDRVPPQRQGRRPAPPRDPNTGQFVGRGAMDHSGLEDLMAGGFNG